MSNINGTVGMGANHVKGTIGVGSVRYASAADVAQATEDYLSAHPPEAVLDPEYAAQVIEDYLAANPATDGVGIVSIEIKEV